MIVCVIMCMCEVSDCECVAAVATEHMDIFEHTCFPAQNIGRVR